MIVLRPKRLGIVLLVLSSFTSGAWATKNEDIHPPSTTAPLLQGKDVGDVRFACLKKAPGQCRMSEFMNYARICALVMVKRGEIRFLAFNEDADTCKDDQGRRNGWEKPYGLASISKSVTSTLLSHALATKRNARSASDFKGLLAQPVDEFVPELKKIVSKGGYAGVPLMHVLNMRSNVRWREYGLLSDNAKFRRQVRNFDQKGFLPKKTIIEFARGYPPQINSQSGRAFNYSALDAAVLAATTERILAGPTLIEFMEAGLWASIGAEAKARWGVDLRGTAIGHCCLDMTIGDLARFGLLVLNRGKNWKGQQLIPPAWFQLATASPGIGDTLPDDYLHSRRAECALGYRFFWWLRLGRTDFTGIGLNGQFLHIYPDDDAIVVQIGDWGNWEEGDERQCETLLAHDALVAAARQ